MRAGGLFASVVVSLTSVSIAIAGDTPSHSAQSVARAIAQRVEAKMEAQPHADPRPGATHAAPASAARRSGSSPSHVAAAPAAHPSERREPGDIWDDLLAGNRRFVESRPQHRPLAQQRLALIRGQHPRAIVLACADSRVSPELVFDQSLGDLFVVRTAGNIADDVVLGSIEYAVEHLHAPVLLVLGHERCGAVQAALSPGDMPTPHLQAIVDRIRPATRRPSTCFEGDELLSRSVAANVHQSARDVLSRSGIVRGHLEQRRLVIQQAVYDLASGVVRPLGAMTQVPVPVAEN